MRSTTRNLKFRALACSARDTASGTTTAICPPANDAHNACFINILQALYIPANSLRVQLIAEFRGTTGVPLPG